MNKFVAVLNPAHPAPLLFNALGHCMLGLAGKADARVLALRPFADADGIALGALTDHPFIVLKASRKIHLVKLIHAADVNEEVMLSAFLAPHRGPNPADQQIEIRASSVCADDVLCVALAGNAESLAPLTKRFSLFNG